MSILEIMLNNKIKLLINYSDKGEGTDARGARRTFLGNGNILNLAFSGGDRIEHICQNSEPRSIDFTGEP